MPVANYRLTVQYDGTAYRGFQLQPEGPTIQGELEQALLRLTGEEVRVHGAGRTDAGVHARGQVVSLTSQLTIPVERLPLALNSVLPRDIVVVGAAMAEPEFHARFSARGKTYSYTIWNQLFPSPFWRNYAWHLKEPLDIQAMRAAADQLVGEHDFSAFQASGSSARNPVRTVSRLDCRQEGPLVLVTVTANGFLYHMVRNFVGLLVAVGTDHLSPEDTSLILAGRDRTQAPPTAPPQGLCLEEVHY
ncbi:MAG: tRNA pseudouridine(38-40) synthase TruA [Bacillota bacterium]